MSKITAVGYDDSTTKVFTFATVLFGIVGMFVLSMAAWQLVYPELNNLAGEYGTYGRLRPIYTNVMIYGFTLSGVFASWYYVGQRVLKVSMRVSPFLMKVARVHFVLYFITISLAVVTLSAGFSTAKQYSQFVWPIDLLVVAWWILWGVCLFGLIYLRREKTMSVSIWYYIATFILFGVVYIFSNIEIPTMFFADGVYSDRIHSVSTYIGSSDVVSQWWQSYDVANIITIFPIFAMVYYFLPKHCGQNIYSYKLTLLSFWGLLFIFFWTGGQDLIYLLVPNTIQTISLTVSVVFIALLWGIGINILLTIKEKSEQLQNNSPLRFFVVATLFFMLYTIQYIKPVRAITIFSDWNTHFVMMGWIGFVLMGALYHMATRIYKREIFSSRFMATHFWLQVMAVLIYFSSMWIADIAQDVMWKSYDEYGSLSYSFVDTIDMLRPYYIAKAIAVSVYFVGFLIFAINIYKTATSGKMIRQNPAMGHEKKGEK